MDSTIYACFAANNFVCAKYILVINHVEVKTLV